MSIRYPNEVTKEIQVQKVNDRIKRYEMELNIVKKALPIIKLYEGKKITKHIATAVSKAFPSDRVYLDDNYGMYHLKITPAGIKIGEGVSMLLGHKGSTNEIVNTEWITGHNQCYLLNEERIPKLKSGINKIASLIEKRNKAISLMQEVYKEAEQYEMDYDFDVEK